MSLKTTTRTQEGRHHRPDPRPPPASTPPTGNGGDRRARPRNGSGRDPRLGQESASPPSRQRRALASRRTPRRRPRRRRRRTATRGAAAAPAEARTDATVGGQTRPAPAQQGGRRPGRRPAPAAAPAPAATNQPGNVEAGQPPGRRRRGRDAACRRGDLQGGGPGGRRTRASWSRSAACSTCATRATASCAARATCPRAKDVYVSISQARRFALRKGDYVEGACRPAASNEKYPALLRIDSVSGLDPEEARNRPRFEDLTPLFPDSRLAPRDARRPRRT